VSWNQFWKMWPPTCKCTFNYIDESLTSPIVLSMERSRQEKMMLDTDNGVLLKAGIKLSVWNDLLMKDHLYSGMLFYDEGNVCCVI
jgi:hypothetical protein